MKYLPAADTPAAAPERVITLSEDGHVRLTKETLLATPLVHLLSDLDEDVQIASPKGTRFAPISGYTEWLSTTTPAISIGWDWRLDISQGRRSYTRLGAPRSNVMLVDARQGDLGLARTSALIEMAIDSLAWEEAVHQYIISRYAGQPVIIDSYINFNIAIESTLGSH